jgi:hypothetical protein
MRNHVNGNCTKMATPLMEGVFCKGHRRGIVNSKFSQLIGKTLALFLMFRITVEAAESR